MDKRFIRLANKEGKKALDRGDYPAGCVIVKNEKVLAKSSSMNITKKDSTVHAEINAIKKACKKIKSRHLDGCVLYSNIEPCLMCAQAIIYARIKKVVYGTEHKEYGDKKTFEILSENNIGKDIEVVRGTEGEKAKELLDIFLKKMSAKEF